MKTTTAEKKISGVAFIAVCADMAAREGIPEERLAHLMFQCARVSGLRTVDEWDILLMRAMKAEVNIQEAIEYGEDEG